MGRVRGEGWWPAVVRLALAWPGTHGPFLVPNTAHRAVARLLGAFHVKHLALLIDWSAMGGRGAGRVLDFTRSLHAVTSGGQRERVAVPVVVPFWCRARLTESWHVGGAFHVKQGRSHSISGLLAVGPPGGRFEDGMPGTMMTVPRTGSDWLPG